MPSNPNFAAQQVRRMEKIFRDYPGERSDIEFAMVNALSEYARDDSHAAEVITRLINGWRNPALAPAELAREKRFCPKLVDVIDACQIEDEPPAIMFQPDEFKTSRQNPLEAIAQSGWFYAEMSDHQLQRWQYMAQHGATAASRKLAADICAAQRERLIAMGEPAWDAERNKANAIEDRASRRVVGHANQKAHCSKCGDTGFRYTQLTHGTGTVVVCQCRGGALAEGADRKAVAAGDAA